MNLSNENIVHIKHNGIEYLQFKKLLEYSDILTHAYSLGISKSYRTSINNKEEYNNTIKNYQQLCNELNLNSNNLVKMDQKHTGEVKIVHRKINVNGPDFNMKEYNSTDGLITNKRNLILSTTNADCILLLIFDPMKKVIANVHSGWKGTLQRIAVNAVKEMCKEYGSKLEDIIVCICPSIRKCHFEVQGDVKELFEKEFQDIDTSKIIEEKLQHTKWNIDTVEINKQILQKIGIKKENIVDSGICSMCNSDLVHSYRIEGKGYGLNTAIIGLK